MPELFRCRPEPLESLVRSVFLALGAPPEPAAESARHLIRANLSGHDSHGVIRVPQYAAQAAADRANARGFALRSGSARDRRSVLTPGELEHRTRLERSRDGI